MPKQQEKIDENKEKKESRIRKKVVPSLRTKIEDIVTC